MVERRHPLLAREGWIHVALVVTVASIGTYVWGIVSTPLWLLALFVIQFFRDPVRIAPAGQDLVICPADGRVIALGRVVDPYLGRPAMRISIFMNVFNVHSNRSPVAGVVQKRWYQPGTFVNAALDKAADRNERNALWLRTDGGVDIVVVQIAGLIARRILCYIDEAQHVDCGQRYGFIRFGSRVDLYLPENAAVRVALGDKVHGGSDVAAVLSGTREA